MVVQLRDGTRVTVRAIRPADKRAIADGVSRSSPESQRRRFLSAKPRLSAAELRYLTEIDGFDHFAVVAERASGEVVAVARFVRLVHDPHTAEAAILVCDALQGRGLGRALALLLADAARERGITRISATVLSDNPAAFALMRTIADRLADDAHGEVHDLVAELAA